MDWLRDLFQYDFWHKPVNSTSKLLFVAIILIPILGGIIYKESNKNNWAGRGGVIIRRAYDAAVEETRPDYRRYINSNRTGFEIEPVRTQPAQQQP